MKKQTLKKTCIIALSSALLCVGTAVGVLTTKKVNADDWDFDLLEEYAYGTEFTVPKATVMVGSKIMEPSSFSVILPDGSATSQENFILDKAGEYYLNYFVQDGNKHYSTTEKFTVKYAPYGVSGSESSTSYGKYDAMGANTNGLYVRLAYKETLTFSKLIDVEDLVKDNALISGFIAPDQEGYADFDKLTVTLSDSVDSSIFVKYEINRWKTSTNAGLAYSFVSFGANGTEVSGFEPGTPPKYHINDDIGTTINGLSFTAQGNGAGGTQWYGDVVSRRPDATIFSLRFNYETKEAFVSTAGSTLRIAMLGDPTLYTSGWSGFDSQKVRLSVSASKYTGTHANFVITSVYGTDIANPDGSFIEYDPPKITVDNPYETMPTAEIGRAYKVPTATAVDEYTGETKVTTAVYYNYGQDNQISVSLKDGAFVPERIGYYTVVYRSKDNFGNLAEETLSVKAMQEVPNVDVIASLPTTVMLGTPIEVGDFTTTGGSGDVEVEITAELNGEVYYLDDTFLPEKQGDWVISYTATDYVGKTQTVQKTVTVTVNPTPVFVDSVVLPKYFLGGAELTLPELYVNDYTTGKLVRKLASVLVTDKNGEKTYVSGETFVPEVENNGDTVKIEYFYGTGDNKVTCTATNVPTVTARDEDGVIMKNYFVGTGFNIEYSRDAKNKLTNGFDFNLTSAGDITWKFAKTQNANAISAIFSTVKDKTNYDEFIFTLTDEFDSSLAVSITAKFTSTGAVVTSGTTTTEIKGDFLNGKSFSVDFNGKKFSFLGTLLTADKTTTGEDFTGFISENVVVSATVKNAKVGDAYKMSSICGQTLSYRTTDGVAPGIIVDGVLSANRSIGSVVYVATAQGYDALAPFVKTTVSVYDPTGKLVTDMNGDTLENVPTNINYEFALTTYGVYKIVYSGEEIGWSGNKGTVECTVVVIDELAPVIRFLTKPTTKTTVGSTVALPKFEVADNLSERENISVTVLCLTASGKQYVISDKFDAFTFSTVGEYRFTYTARDEFGNTSVRTVVVEVTEKGE